MSQFLIDRLNEEATRRWSSVPTHVRELLNSAALAIEVLRAKAEELEDQIADLQAQLRTERDLNVGPVDPEAIAFVEGMLG